MKTHGFTLIQLIAAITVLGVLVAIGISRMSQGSAQKMLQLDSHEIHDFFMKARAQAKSMGDERKISFSGSPTDALILLASNGTTRLDSLKLNRTNYLTNGSADTIVFATGGGITMVNGDTIKLTGEGLQKVYSYSFGALTGNIKFEHN